MPRYRRPSWQKTGEERGVEGKVKTAPAGGSELTTTLKPIDERPELFVAPAAYGDRGGMLAFQLRHQLQSRLHYMCVHRTFCV